MKITNLGDGIHQREIRGIEVLKDALPNDWYAYTNMEFVVSAGTTREIDVVVVAPEMVFVIDLKDWHGKVESSNGYWLKDGKDHGKSPVGKVSENARQIGTVLREHIKRHSKGKRISSPFVHGAIVMTGNCDISEIAPAERALVHSVHDFIKKVDTRKNREKHFGEASDAFYRYPLTSDEWRDRLGKFFNVRKSYFEPGKRRFGEYVASKEFAEFKHANEIFQEYEASSTVSKASVATLRLWDFTKADTRFQSASARKQIAGRERRVCDFLSETDEDFPSFSLRTKLEDIEFSPDYWEVYERRAELSRLSSIPRVALLRKSCSDRVELVRQVVSKVAILHRQNASHLDLGEHSVWIQEPNTVKLSHFMSASIPDDETLGDARFQFLSSSSTPEDIYEQKSESKRKDVYLLGLLSHKILFGDLPEHDKDFDTMVWDAQVDEADEFTNLHPWIAKMIVPEPKDRFPSAVEALEAFGKAVKSKSWNAEVVSELERYSATAGSVFEFFSKFPMTQPIDDTSEKVIWRSHSSFGDCVVKLWKSTCWKSLETDALRILQHLKKLESIKASELDFLPPILSVHWLGDHMGFVQKWVEGQTLMQTLEVQDFGGKTSLTIAVELVEAIEQLHERGWSHGDLKPANILVPVDEETSLKLIDVVDFGHHEDGEKKNSAYSQDAQDTFARDRYALAKIIEELSVFIEEESVKDRVFNGMRRCLSEADGVISLDEIKSIVLGSEDNSGDSPNISLRLTMIGAEGHQLAPDEGNFYVRRLVGKGSGWALRGATEQVLVFLNDKGEVERALLRDVTQGEIARFSKYEIGCFCGEIQISKGSWNDVSDLLKIQEHFELENDVGDVQVESVDAFEEDDDEVVGSSDHDADALDELIAVQQGRDDLSFVDDLWKTLLETELEQETTAISTADSSVDEKEQKTKVPYELQTGSLDFRLDDTITVESFIKKTRRWRRVGSLDLRRTNSDLAYLDDTAEFEKTGRARVAENQRLRFLSHFEETSRQRRRQAVERILSKKSESPYLLDVFNGSIVAPMKSSIPDIDFSHVKELHGLNQSQLESLKLILECRPIGMLQGPPGTGKTKFISSLVHCALEAGLARNVLIASQSHEAVNNAADAVLQRFEGEKLDLLRVGHEGQISGKLRRYSSRSLEIEKRELFSATVASKIQIAAAMSDVSLEVAKEVIGFETTFKPLVEKYFGLLTRGAGSQTDRTSVSEISDRTLGHIERSLRKYNAAEMLSDFPFEEGQAAFLSASRSKAAGFLELDDRKYHILAEVAEIIRDFKNSISTGVRNFDTFLAGTRQVVAGTCVGLGRSSLGLTTTPFDLVVVDEAARCAASELAVPLQAGRWVVLVGDQAQLEPLHDQGIVRATSQSLGIEEREVQRSDFERLFVSSYGRNAASLLSTQYRMLAPIGELVSKSFYNGKLNHGRTKKAIDVVVPPICLTHPICWVPTDELGKKAEQSPVGTSYTNRAEADVIINLMRLWGETDEYLNALDNTGYENPIGIICMYAEQRNLIRANLAKTDVSARLRRMIKIDTVDSYQGKENPVVVLSLVRNNKFGSAEQGHPTIRQGFMARDNRVNVAFSRAMDNLVIVGAKTNWPAQGPLGRVRTAFDAQCAKDDACVVRPSEIRQALQTGRNGQ